MANGIDEVAVEFASFCSYLESERAIHMDALAQLGNGFEGWLKIEFVLWLAARGLAVAVREGEVHADIGVEYKFSLDQRRKEMDREQKQCDVWIRSAKNPRLFHYLELKVPFAGVNTKTLMGAGDDLWYVTRPRKTWEQAATGSVIVVGVGFDEPGWTGACQLVSTHAHGAFMDPSGKGTIGGGLRWAVWTTVLSQ